MLALVTQPGVPGSARVEEVPTPVPAAGEVLVRALEVGVCGTDREICEGLFGIAPAGGESLILGHELLGTVERDGHGFARGDLVTATVRRACGHCRPCAEGAPDACATGDYVERGITRLHGFAGELVAEAADQLIPVPRVARPAGRAGRAGVDLRPRAAPRLRGRRAPAMGAAAGARARRGGDRDARHRTCCGSAASRPGPPRARRPEARRPRWWPPPARATCPWRTRRCRCCARTTGGFDVVIEAAGNAQLMLDTLGLLRRGGVACLLGLDGRPRRIALDGPVLGVDTVLENRVLLGSVNAHRTDWEAAVAALARRPGALAGGAGALRRPARPARPLRGRVRVPRRQGDAADRARGSGSGVRVALDLVAQRLEARRQHEALAEVLGVLVRREPGPIVAISNSTPLGSRK